MQQGVRVRRFKENLDVQRERGRKVGALKGGGVKKVDRRRARAGLQRDRGIVCVEDGEEIIEL